MVPSLPSPATIRTTLRGKGETYTEVDLYLFKLKRLARMSDVRHYRLCLICSKIAQYVARFDHDPDLYQAKIDLRFRELVELIHSHVEEVGMSEHTFYEYLLQAWAIMNQEIKFIRDPYYHFLRIVFEEHAKYLAGKDGKPTPESILEFCTQLDHAASEAIKQIVPDHYHLYLGPQHPMVKLLFRTKGAKEEKIPPHIVKDDIRRTMIAAAAYSIKGASNPMVTHALDFLAKHPPSPEQKEAYRHYLSTGENPTQTPLPASLQIIYEQLVRVQSSSGATKNYTFQQLQSMGRIDLGSQHPFVHDFCLYQSLYKTASRLLDNVEGLKTLALSTLVANYRALEAEQASLAPRVALATQKAAELQPQLALFPSTIIEDSNRATNNYVVLKIEAGARKILFPTQPTPPSLEADLAKARADFYEQMSQLSRYKALSFRLQPHLELLTRYELLTQKLKAAELSLNNKDREFALLIDGYRQWIYQQLNGLEEQTYRLSSREISLIFKSLNT